MSTGTITTNKILGDLIKALRKRARLKQTVCAETIGVSSAVWSKIENGNREVPIGRFCAIARMLDITPEEMFRRIKNIENHYTREGMSVV